MDYIGEHPAIGQLGNAFIILAFSAALFASISYFFAARKELNSDEYLSWKKLGRIGFNIHALSVLGIVLVLFYMLINHYYEYDYVNRYSNNAMPMKYIVSCFWGGQEGSFLLWISWHVIIGLFLYRKAGTWEAPVMSVFSFAQVFLASMLLGVYLWGDSTMGISPFALKREVASGAGVLWSLLPNYTELDAAFRDGDGLNPLLQNYWMTIHPPMLFLGFAATLVPFCYAIAALWKKQYHQWIKPALPWTFFGIAALGLGILMGGAWAYESLSFGGFWAWDPVENASLVPWITLVGAGHLMLINRNKPTSLFSTFLLVVISFFLILYSTFLTRSGVLGDSSVHSFTDSGMLVQLLLFMVAFTALGFYMMLINRTLKLFFFGFAALLTIVMVVLAKSSDEVLWGIPVLIAILGTVAFLATSYFKYFPTDKKEEKTWSREFWMFIGSLVLLISAIHIITQTSKPIFQDLFGLQRGLAIGEAERFETYHSWQIPLAIIITLLVGVGQYFSYRKTDMKKFKKKIMFSFLGSLVIATLFIRLLGYEFDGEQGADYNYDVVMYILLILTSSFCVLANINYFVRVVKGKVKHSGSSIAHVGFGLLILGALLSQSKQTTISKTVGGMMLENLSEDFQNNKNALMFKGDTVPMGEYFAVYNDKFKDDINIYYNIEYYEQVQQTDSTYQPGNKLFEVQPFVQLNERFNNIAEPGTKHFVFYDVFTNVKWADVTGTETEMQDDWMAPNIYERQFVGDTIKSPSRIMIIEGAEFIENNEPLGLDSNDLAWKVHLNVYDGMFTYQNQMLELYFALEDGTTPLTSPVYIPGFKTEFEVANVNLQDGAITIETRKKEYIVLEATVFPFINILWVGCIIMVLGTLLAVWNRFNMNRGRNGD